MAILSMLLIWAASTLSYAETGGVAKETPAPANARQTAMPNESAEATGTERTAISLRRMAEAAFEEALAPFSEELASVNLSTYAQVAAQRDLFYRMASALNASFSVYYLEAMRLVSRDLRALALPLLKVERGDRPLDWQRTAALYCAYRGETSAALANGLRIDFDQLAGGVGFVCAFSESDALFSAGTREQLMTARFTLAYLYTVFDDMGRRAAIKTPELPADYLATLVHPLPGCMIKDGWYDPRSGSTRLHTGTDIRAKRNAEIHAVTAGEVLYVGFSRIPGYYVIMRDSRGYEYHYYHMVRQSEHVAEGDRVRQGQTIGLVGSTGNSAANHLHLAIVNPEGAYINPYEVFLQAGIGPIRARR